MGGGGGGGGGGGWSGGGHRDKENTTRLRTELHTKKADIVQLEHLLLLILLFAQLSDLPPFSASVFLDF